MSTGKRPQRSVLVGLAGIVVIAAVLTGWVMAHQTARAAGPSNDYPWANATDCSVQYGIFSWCLNGSDMSPLGFGYRNCTDYAAYELNEQMGGNLSHLKFTWSDINVKTADSPNGDGNAREWWQGTINHFGASHVNHTPAIGAVAWWGPVSSGSSFGHVGIVAKVSPDQKAIVVYSYNAKGDGNFFADAISTNKPGLYPWPDAFLHIADVSGATGGSGEGQPSDYANKIVQWDNGPHAQKSAWLVSPDLKRYWIPDGGTFNCLTSSGFALAGTLSATMLNQLPDQTGHWARCGGNTLGMNQYLFRGASLSSSNGQYQLVLRKRDGNLVLSGPASAAQVIISQPSDYLVLQPGGNLVAYTYSGGATWSSDTGGMGVDHLVVTNDGNLGLYTPDNRLKWTTLFDSRLASVTLTPTATLAPGAQPTATPQPTATFTPTPTPTVTPVPPQTWTEQEGDYGANSFSDPHNASGMGPRLAAMTYVQVTCKLYDPYIASVNPDGYWYLIASYPFSNQYYVAANTFWNGDIPGHKPYTHNTDWNVRNC